MHLLKSLLSPELIIRSLYNWFKTTWQRMVNLSYTVTNKAFFKALGWHIEHGIIFKTRGCQSMATILSQTKIFDNRRRNKEK